MQLPSPAATHPKRGALTALLTALIVAGCGGGAGGGGLKGTSGDFVVLRSEPHNNNQLFLNESLAFEFSNHVDLSSADFNAVSFAVFDLNGQQLAEQVEGVFQLARAEGDVSIGRRLEFKPKFPTTDTYDNGGFRPQNRWA